jgi:hypothetical protein
LVKVGKKKELKEVELIGTKEAVQLRTTHAFGISIISFSTEDALQLRDEIEEWITDNARENPKTEKPRFHESER